MVTAICKIVMLLMGLLSSLLALPRLEAPEPKFDIMEKTVMQPACQPDAATAATACQPS